MPSFKKLYVSRSAILKVNNGHVYIQESKNHKKLNIVKAYKPLPTIADQSLFLKTNPSRDIYSDDIAEENEFSVFPNKANDTVLIVPTEKFASIREFAAEADLKSWKLLWDIVNEVRLDYYEDTGVLPYVSTHGHGVPQLHVRLEETPKYYNPK